ncbi:MAG: 30S ribosomal protein S15 [Thermoplasmata archaeon]
MARMHARRRGASSSKKPFRTEKLTWVTTTPSEIEEIIVKLSKEGISTSVIGIKLRDIYGVPDVKEITGKSITEILEKQGIKASVPEDLQNLINRATELQSHLSTNPKDLHNKRRLQLLGAKIKRLRDYYGDKGILTPTADHTHKAAPEQK